MGKGKDAALNAWLGQETRLEGGRLHFEGSLRIDGVLLDADLTGRALIIGESARVSGRANVDELDVFGSFDGVVRVRESAHVAPGGVFQGELQLEEPELNIDEGGTFEGRVAMAPED